MIHHDGNNHQETHLGPTNEGVNVVVVDESVGTEDPTIRPLPESLRRQLEARRRSPLPPPEDSTGQM